MRREIRSWFSPNLQREMSVALFGHFGYALLLFPTWSADHLEYERFGMIEALQEFIEGGVVKVYCVDALNDEIWMATQIPVAQRARRYLLLNRYFAEEVVPFIMEDCNGFVPIVTSGASMGAHHAVNQFFKHPDLYAGTVGMSGSYDLSERIEEDEFDENCYFNSPIHYIANMNELLLEPFRQGKEIHFVCGQGENENPAGSIRISNLLTHKGIPHTLDLWGTDVPHDWPSWRKMMRHYIGNVLFR
ncbi:MAG: esterase [Deltaproteobacteria bacterium]|nr:MAG: esterase [Deltaproteobacteria bacterium]